MTHARLEEEVEELLGAKAFQTKFLLFLECLDRVEGGLIKTLIQEPKLCRRKRVGLPRQKQGNLL